MGHLVSSLTNLTRVDRSQAEVGKKAALIFEEITELSAQLRHYQETIEFNQIRLNQVEERIGVINNLIPSIHNRFGLTYY